MNKKRNYKKIVGSLGSLGILGIGTIAVVAQQCGPPSTATITNMNSNYFRRIVFGNVISNDTDGNFNSHRSLWGSLNESCQTAGFSSNCRPVSADSNVSGFTSEYLFLTITPISFSANNVLPSGVSFFDVNNPVADSNSVSGTNLGIKFDAASDASSPINLTITGEINLQGGSSLAVTADVEINALNINTTPGGGVIREEITYQGENAPSAETVFYLNPSNFLFNVTNVQLPT